MGMLLLFQHNSPGHDSTPMRRRFSYSHRLHSYRWLRAAGLGLLLLTGGGVFQTSRLAAQKPKPAVNRTVTVVPRVIKVREIQGAVTFLDQGMRPAAMGDRLSQVKEGIRTGNHASAVLVLDDGLSAVRVSENTEVRLKRFSRTLKGGSVTLLLVPRGQMNFKVQPFTNHESRLQVETPAGIVTAQRGDLGITITPNGKTAIATRGGTVIVTAKAKSIALKPGYSTVLLPGEPPVLNQSMQESVKLRQLALTPGNDQVRIQTEVDPRNLVFVNNQSLTMGRDGKVDNMIPLPPDRRVRIVVRTPYGTEQLYERSIP